MITDFPDPVNKQFTVQYSKQSRIDSKSFFFPQEEKKKSNLHFMSGLHGNMKDAWR